VHTGEGSCDGTGISGVRSNRWDCKDARKSAKQGKGKRGKVGIAGRPNGGKACCTSYCVDTDNDSDICSRCGNERDKGESCVDGKRASICASHCCPTGQCKQRNTTGACTYRCNEGETYDDGTCKPTCPGRGQPCNAEMPCCGSLVCHNEPLTWQPSKTCNPAGDKNHGTYRNDLIGQRIWACDDNTTSTRNGYRVGNGNTRDAIFCDSIPCLVGTASWQCAPTCSLRPEVRRVGRRQRRRESLHHERAARAQQPAHQRHLFRDERLPGRSVEPQWLPQRRQEGVQASRRQPARRPIPTARQVALQEERRRFVAGALGRAQAERAVGLLPLIFGSVGSTNSVASMLVAARIQGGRIARLAPHPQRAPLESMPFVGGSREVRDRRRPAPTARTQRSGGGAHRPWSMSEADCPIPGDISSIIHEYFIEIKLLDAPRFCSSADHFVLTEWWCGRFASVALRRPRSAGRAAKGLGAGDEAGRLGGDRGR
jgi:hypothetical protein